jgi:20S proteasome subunit alpha 3
LACEKKIQSKLLDQHSAFEKIVRIASNLVVCVGGITSDSNSVVDHARAVYERYGLTYGEPMPVELLVQSVCNYKQTYTQHGGMRPYGVSFLYAGWDRHRGWQLYQSDPSGNYSGWRATAIGTNSTVAAGILKTDLVALQDQHDKDSIGMIVDAEKAQRLLVKILHKTFESANVDADKVEMALLTRDPSSSASSAPQVALQAVPKAQLSALIANYQAELKAAAASS